jgi:hypothetical protein
MLQIFYVPTPCNLKPTMNLFYQLNGVIHSNQFRNTWNSVETIRTLCMVLYSSKQAMVTLRTTDARNLLPPTPKVTMNLLH